MATAETRVLLQSSPEAVWSVVTDLSNTAWRSDIASVEVVEPGKRFVERTAGGVETAFTITEFIPCSRYEFDMDNKNLMGRWTGRFQSAPGGGTILVMVENATAKSALLGLVLPTYLRRQQKRFIADLKAALGE